MPTCCNVWCSRRMSLSRILPRALLPAPASTLTQLRSANPQLITVDITGYGDSGPYREMKAYDLLVQCESGLASITGAPQQPGRVGVSVCDIACGMYAHAGILEALLERQQTGLGKGLSVSLFDALADWMTVPLLYQEYTGKAPARVGLRHPSIAPYGAYACGDGEEVVIAIQNEREWTNFCELVLQHPDLLADSRYATNVRAVATVRHWTPRSIACLQRFRVWLWRNDCSRQTSPLGLSIPLPTWRSIRNCDARR